MDTIEKIEVLAKPLYVGNDCAHDWLHVMRVTNLGRLIARKEKADFDIVVAACLLHDCVMHPKASPKSSDSAEDSAKKALEILAYVGFPAEKAEKVAYAIRVHGYSKGVTPESLEGKVLQDADKLDASGAVGIARTFSTGAILGGILGRPFYVEDDPFCRRHAPEDKFFTLDHFYRKLLLLEDKMNTRTGKAVARRRGRFLKLYLKEFEREMKEGSTKK